MKLPIILITPITHITIFSYLCHVKNSETMNSITKYARLVKFSHTIFAMPFALLSFTYAWTTAEHSAPLWLILLQVVGCMVFARNVAMGFNRWADRFIDA